MSYSDKINGISFLPQKLDLKNKLAGKILVTMNCPPKRLRRNGLCSCGSGKKFKNCCR